MSKKVIKLTISDLEKIVNRTISESEGFDDFDTQVHPEETSDGDSYDERQELMLTLAQKSDGTFIAIKNADSDNPEIIDLPF